jgi:uncharacterized membrane protein
MTGLKHSSHRLGFIDQLRGWAVIVMIEVHVFNEWLRPDLKQLFFWRFLTFFNGMVAPSFVMLAGFSLGLAAVRKWDDYIRPGLPLWKRVRHLLLIIIVGYLLRLPARSYRLLKYWPLPEKINEFFAVDVLHLIVISLLVLHLIILVTRSRKVLLWSSIVLGATAFLLTPWTYQTTFFEQFPLWFKNYFNRAHGSLFPLFPWSGFVFWGAAIAMIYADWQKGNKGDTFINRMGVAGAVLVIVCIASDLIPITLQSNYQFWWTSPQFSFLRLGLVMITLSVLRYLERTYHFAPKSAVLMGQESFLVYALHLVVLYSVIGTHSLVTAWKGQLNYFWCLVGYLALLIPMFGAAWCWRYIKSKNIRTARWIMAGLALVLIFVFLFFENGRFVFWILNPNDPYK